MNIRGGRNQVISRTMSTSYFSSTCKVTNSSDQWVCVMGFVGVLCQAPPNNFVHAIAPGESREINVTSSLLAWLTSRKVCIAVIVRVDACDVANHSYLCDCFCIDCSSELVISKIESGRAYAKSNCINEEVYINMICEESNISNIRKCVSVYQSLPGRVHPENEDIFVIHNDTTSPQSSDIASVIVKIWDVREVVGVSRSFDIQSSYDQRDLQCLTDVPPGGTLSLRHIPSGKSTTNIYQLVYPTDWSCVCDWSRKKPKKFATVRAMQYLQLRPGYRYHFVWDGVSNQKTTCLVTRLRQSDGGEGAPDGQETLLAEKDFLKVVPRKGMVRKHTLRLRLVVTALQQLQHREDGGVEVDPTVLTYALASRDIYTSTQVTGWEYLAGKDTNVSCNELTRWALWRSSVPSASTAPDTDTRTAVLVFRGTHLDDSLQDILHNISVQTVRVEGTKATHVHSGFFCAVENEFEAIVRALRESGVTSFDVTGHSLGGGLAQLFALKYMILRPQSQDGSAVLRRVVTFGAPMTLWCLHSELPAEDASYLRPWMDVCVNYIYRADPVPMLPRLLTDRHCWNLMVDVISKLNWYGYLLQNYTRVPVDGTVPPGLFTTLSFSCGFRPPGNTIMLLGDAKPLLLNPRAMQRLSTTYDTIVRLQDGFSHHWLAAYIDAVKNTLVLGMDMSSVSGDTEEGEEEGDDVEEGDEDAMLLDGLPPPSNTQHLRGSESPLSPGGCLEEDISESNQSVQYFIVDNSRNRHALAFRAFSSAATLCEDLDPKEVPGGVVVDVPYEMTRTRRMVYPCDWRSFPKKLTSIPALKYLRLRNGYRFSFLYDEPTKKSTGIVTKLVKQGVGNAGVTAEGNTRLSADDDFLKVIPRKGMINNHTLRLQLVSRALQQLFHVNEEHLESEAHYDAEVLSCTRASNDIYTSVRPDGWHHLASGDVDISSNRLTRWALWKTDPSSQHNILVFRGTALDQSMQDIFHDAAFQTVRVEGTKATHVHSGFFCAVENEFEAIVRALRESGVTSFDVTGHSLGGGLAQLFALKYMILRPQSQDGSAVLRRVVTFGAPMTLWCLHSELPAEDASYLRPWMDVCVNYIYRADPVPMLPRLLSCRYIWNSFFDMLENQIPLFLGYLNPSYFLNIRISRHGEPPALFTTLSFSSGYRPPGNTIMLLGDAAPLILNARAMQKLSTTFDTIFRFQDLFDHHMMAGYIAAMEAAPRQVGAEVSIEAEADDDAIDWPLEETEVPSESSPTSSGIREEGYEG